MTKLTKHMRRLIASLTPNSSHSSIPRRAISASLLAIVLWATHSGAYAITIEVNPASQVVNLGDPVSVDIDIRDLGVLTAPSISTFDITVDFDTALLDLTSVVFGTELDLGVFGSFQETTGTGPIDVFEISFEDSADLNILQPSAFTLFTLTFDTLASGSSAVGLSLTALGDADGATLSADTIDGSIRIVDPNFVPVPATLALLGLGVCLIVCRQRSSLSRA